MSKIRRYAFGITLSILLVGGVESEFKGYNHAMKQLNSQYVQTSQRILEINGNINSPEKGSILYHEAMRLTVNAAKIIQEDNNGFFHPGIELATKNFIKENKKSLEDNL